MSINQKFKKIMQAVAADHLVPVEMCVLTGTVAGLFQVWFQTRVTDINDPVDLARLAWEDLSLTHNREWISPSKTLTKVDVGYHDTANKAVCAQYAHLDEYQFHNSGIEDIAVTTYVHNLIERLRSTSTAKEEIKDVYTIKTKYEVDSMIFDNIDDAQNHVKTTKIFDEFENADPDANYFDYQNVIDAMVANPQKFIDILQGK